MAERKAGPQGCEAEGDRLLEGQDFGIHEDRQDAGDHLDYGLHEDEQNVGDRVEYVQELAAALGEIVWNLQE